MHLLYYTHQGLFFLSEKKRIINDQKYLNFEEEEDTDDDLGFKYKVFEELSPIDAAQKNECLEIVNLLIKFI